MRGKIWSAVLLSSETRQGHPLLLLSFKFVSEDLSNTIKEKCEMVKYGLYVLLIK